VDHCLRSGDEVLNNAGVTTIFLFEIIREQAMIKFPRLFGISGGAAKPQNIQKSVNRRIMPLMFQLVGATQRKRPHCPTAPDWEAVDSMLDADGDVDMVADKKRKAHDAGMGDWGSRKKQKTEEDSGDEEARWENTTRNPDKLKLTQCKVRSSPTHMHANGRGR